MELRESSLGRISLDCCRSPRRSLKPTMFTGTLALELAARFPSPPEMKAYKKLQELQLVFYD